jgi:hypothetical protein
LRYHDGARWTPGLAPYPTAYSTGGLDPSNPSHRMLMPVGRTPLSIIAGYVALLSVLLVPAPAALVLGICALAQLRHRQAAFGRGRAIFAIAMGGLFSVVLVAAMIAGLSSHR